MVLPVLATDLPGLADQISRDSQLAVKFGQTLSGWPFPSNLPSPQASGFSGQTLETYSQIFGIFSEMVQTKGAMETSAKKVLEWGQVLESSWLKRVLFFATEAVHNPHSKPVIDAVNSRQDLAESYNKITQFNAASFFEKLSIQEELNYFSGRVTVNGKTYSLLSSDALRLIPPPSPPPFSVLLFNVKMTEPVCFFSLLHGVTRYDFRAPSYFQVFYNFGTPVSCIDNLAAPQREIETFINGLALSADYPVRLGTFLSDVSAFVSGCNNYLANRRVLLFEKSEEVFRKLVDFENAELYIFNSTVVREALGLVQFSTGATATYIIESPGVTFLNTSDKVYEIHKLLTVCRTMGECLRNQDKAEVELSLIERDLGYADQTLTELKKIFEDKCSFYVTQSASNVTCVYGGARGDALLKTAESLLKAYSDYLQATSQKTRASAALQSLFSSKFQHATGLLDSIQPFLGRDTAFKFYLSLSNLKDKASSESEPEKLQKSISELEDLMNEMKKKFFSANADKAEQIRQKLLWHHSLSNFTGFTFELPSYVFTPVSATSDFVPQMISILRLESHLAELETLLQQQILAYASDLPHQISCSPAEPLLNYGFTVSCRIMVSSTYPGRLAEAFTFISLPFPTTKQLDARAVTGGDISRLSSLVGEDSRLKISLKLVQDPILIEVTYPSLIETPVPAILNQSFEGDTYHAYYTTSPVCPTHTAVMVMASPLPGLAMNSSHTYYQLDNQLAVRVTCNRTSLIHFYGRAISLKTSGDNLIIENHAPVPAETTLFLPYTPGLVLSTPYNVSGDMITFDVNVTTTQTLKVSKKVNASPVEANTAPELPSSGNPDSNFSDTLREAAREALNQLEPVTLGCLDADIIKEVQRRYGTNVPPLSCLKTDSSVYESALVSFQQEAYWQVLELYRNQTYPRDVEVYLAQATAYKPAADEALQQAVQSSSGTLASQRVSPYLTAASEAYARGDYPAVIYYARYALIKAPLGMSINWRVILALVVLVAGLFFQFRRKPREEPLL